MSTYLEIRKQINELRDQSNKLFRDYFTTEANKIFEEHPLVEEWSFTAYTPYFNDGDTCVYQVNCDYPKLNGEDWSDCGNLTHWDKNPNPDYSLEKYKAHEAVTEFLGGLAEDDMAETFGDHVEVTIRKDGTVDIQSYEHD